jgi:hypothetical protein
MWPENPSPRLRQKRQPMDNASLACALDILAWPPSWPRDPNPTLTATTVAEALLSFLKVQTLDSACLPKTVTKSVSALSATLMMCLAQSNSLALKMKLDGSSGSDTGLDDYTVLPV